MQPMKTSIVVDLDGNLTERAERFSRALSGMASSGQRSLQRMSGTVRAASGNIDKWGNRTALAGVAVGYAFSRTFIRTSAQFERFESILGTIEGSSEKAKASMAWVTDFAARTPYELEEVTGAFVKLKSYGINPQTGALKSAGDAAAAMGKPLEQAVEALADAMTGENERLKEFGITTQTTGDKITYRWQQNGKSMVAVAKKSSKEQIEAVITGIWNSRYKGAMDNLSGTWDGMMSNLGDTWTVFQKDVMNSGGFQFVKDELKGLLDEIQRMKDSGEYDELVNKVGTELTEAFKTVKATVIEVRDTVRELQPTLKATADAISKVVELGGGGLNIAKWLGVLYILNKTLRLLMAVSPMAKALLQAGKWTTEKALDLKPTPVAPGSTPTGRGGAGGPSSRGGAGGPSPRGGLGGRGGAVPVYLVDGPMSTIPDRNTPGNTPGNTPEGPHGDPAKETSKPAGRGRNALNTGKHVLKEGAPLAAVGGLIETAMVLSSDAPIDEKVVGVGGAVGGATGAWAGAALGAAAGSFIPIIGTAIGAMLGGAIGYAGGEWLGKETGQVINSALDLKLTVEAPPGTKANVSGMKATGADLNTDVYYNGGGMAP